MNKIIRISILLVLFSFCLGITTADAQRRKKKRKKPQQDEYFDESGSFRHRLWYGGGFNLGFAGSNNYSVFNFGLSPMVGFKVTEEFSVGPRVGIQYTYIKGTGTDLRTHSVSPLSYSVGLFTRYKAFSNFFAHLEYGVESEQQIATLNGFLFIDPETNEVFTERQNNNRFYGGVGYNSGGIVAYEILLLYNFIADDQDVIDFPWDIRFGITYNF